eukprot:Phypoly_transcript_05843.p1 GENE.Phypoly_transcript_05843~~Phypoly_transcript_05843.p1  ORF type:complete len:617 (+),score=73.87 Phypoly_transcript_05843:224-1852(+)
MNYWEPTHYLMYGYGLQTWEYSPVYALRSYLYIMIHAFFGNIANIFFGGSKVTVFYVMRTLLAVLCAYGETFFYSKVERKFGPTVGFFTFVFLLFSAGMTQAAPSFLPSTFAMYSFLFAFGNWFSGKFQWAVFFAALGVLLGWPFAAVIVVPMALDTLLRRRHLAVLWAALSVGAIMIPMLFVDYLHYHKFVVALWNITVYNSGGGDSVLYGVEPWYFYLLNGFLNFNIVFVLFLVSFPLVAFYAITNPRHYGQYAAYLLGAFLWIGFLSMLPHKEERFLYPMYPLVCLGAALAIYFVAQTIMKTSSKLHRLRFHRTANFAGSLLGLAMLAVIFGSMALSVSRTIGQHRYYHAPMEIWQHLSDTELASGDESKMLYSTNTKVINICVGKEWYRFPSHFFIPNSNNYRTSQKFKFSFVKSSFDGLLPKYYGPYPNGTWTIPTTMNDRNKEEKDRYIDTSACHYLVDFDYPDQVEPHYPGAKVSDKGEGVWETVTTRKFLVQGKSASFARAFWIPFVSEKYVTYSDYYLLRNSELMKKKKNKAT